MIRHLLPGSTCAAALLLLLPACEKTPPTAAPKPTPQPSSLVIPSEGAYTGAFLDFGDFEDEVTLEKIDAFQEAVGKHQAIIAFSSYWGQDSFPTRALGVVSRYGAMPLVYWSPWGKPYLQDHSPDDYSLQAILAGTWDGYIDAWADGAKAFGRPLFVAWGLEMNGTWFPWSGYYYGAGKEIAPGVYAGPEIYKKAYRYVVDRVRARGVKNILWVFHTNNRNAPNERWNAMGNYYPGDDYVDWLGMSAYGVQFRADSWIPVEQAFADPYKELCGLNADKPVMMAEWGIGNFPSTGDKARWIADALAFMQSRMPRLRAAIFWNERWENSDGSYSNLRVTSSPQAVQAYRTGIAGPYWLSEPVYR